MLTDQVRGGRLIPGGVGLDQFDAPFADRFVASMDEAWTRSPLSTIWRAAERAMEEPVTDIYPDDPFASDMAAPPREYSRLVPAEELEERYSHLDLKFDRPTREAVAAMVAGARAEELARQRVLARSGDAGWLEHASLFGAGLLATIADPINVASAFIPIAGHARWAALASRIGQTGARAARGAAEGVAGAALVEPIVLAGAIAESADYTSTDSLINLAFGGVMGGGLHVAGGAVADAMRGGAGRSLQDRLSRALPETREALLRTAVAQSVMGRHVDVEPILNADPRVRRTDPEVAAAAPGVPRQTVEAALTGDRLANIRAADAGEALRAWEVQAPAITVPEGYQPSPALLAQAEDLARGGPPRPRRGDARYRPGLADFVRAEGGIRGTDANAGDLRASGLGGLRGVIRQRGRSADEMLTRALEEGYLGGPAARADTDISSFITALAEDAAEPGRHLSRADEGFVDDRQVIYKQNAEYLSRELDLPVTDMAPRELAWLLEGAPERARLVSLEAQERAGGLTEDEAIERELLVQQLAGDEIDAAGPVDGAEAAPGLTMDEHLAHHAVSPEDFAARQAVADADALADPDASLEMDAILEARDLADERLEEFADHELSILELTDEEAAELAAANTLVTDANEFAAGVDALATCRIG